MAALSATIACAGYPATLHCQRRARIAVVVGRGHSLPLPLCEDCAYRVRAAGELVESWGDLTAARFAPHFRAAIAPDVAAGRRPAI